MYTALSTRALNISANEAAHEADKTKKIKIRNKRKGEKAVKKKDGECHQEDRGSIGRVSQFYDAEDDDRGGRRPV